MIVRTPDYYNKFHCIASECKHSCCQSSWEIDVDDETYRHYCQVPGEFGEKLRNSIKKEKHKYFKMRHGKCPFLSADHLCTVYTTLGEGAMCEVCTEYPRFWNEFGNTRELILGLSCEEAGRILFSKKVKIHFVDSVLEEGQIAEDAAAAKEDNEKKTYLDSDRKIETARNYCIDILQDREVPLKDRIAGFLVFCGQIQKCLDNNDSGNITEVIAKYAKGNFVHSSKESSRAHELFQKRTDLLMAMDAAQEEWTDEMNNVMRAFYAESQEKEYREIAKEFALNRKEQDYEYEHLMVYFAYRYLIDAVYDRQFLEKAKFCVLCYLIIRDMDRMRYLIRGMEYTVSDRIDTARIFCKEVEHSDYCKKYLKDKIGSEEVFQTDAMIEEIYG